MADYTGTDVSSSAGTTVPERAGTTLSDTVAAGTRVLWRNTGAGTHVVTLTTNNTVGDLAVADRVISIPAGAVKAGPVPLAWGDADGKVPVAIDGTASEVKYYVLGEL